MKYAPVIIYTLNRDEHLNRLLDSLNKNEYAKNVEVYISIDYPPNAKYEEGHQRVCALLSNYPNTFKKLHIYMQKKNLGSYQNAMFLIRKVLKKGDRFIALEDDNEVSPNFLEYMCICLEKFKDYKDIVGICANSEVLIRKQKHSENIQKKERVRKAKYQTYGFATWKDRFNNISLFCQDKSIWNAAANIFKMYKFYNMDKYLYCRFILDVLYKKPVACYKNRTIPIDVVWDIYAALSDKFFIIPYISKIRNYGFDGTGNTMGRMVGWRPDYQQIDQNLYFDPDWHIEYSQDDVLRMNEAYSQDSSVSCYAKLLHFLYLVTHKKSVEMVKFIKAI